MTYLGTRPPTVDEWEQYELHHRSRMSIKPGITGMWQAKDSSLSICKEYELKDSRIRVFHKENEGLGLTRNYGIERATGEYITFVDSDDYLTSDAIAAMLDRAIATNADVVIATHYYKNEVSVVLVQSILICH